MNSRFTVLGGGGFIGSALARRLREMKADCFSPSRSEAVPYDQNLGHVIYCIGLNGILASKKPFEMVDAHVRLAADVLKNARYESFLYLSSTRVYDHGSETSEPSWIRVNPESSNNVYTVSKLMGESICLSSQNPAVRIARPSNVYGLDLKSSNFLPSLIRDALTQKKLALQSAADSEKDYVSLDDAVALLIRIAQSGRRRIYNIASGGNIAHGKILDVLKGSTGCSVEIQPQASKVVFKPIDNARIKEEFNFSPRFLLEDLPGLVGQYREALTVKK